MKKIILHTKLAFNQWYLTQLAINPRLTTTYNDWRKHVKYQRRVVKLLEKKTYGRSNQTK